MALVLLLAGWVCLRVYRARGSEGVLYPLLLWLNALGSCVGAIANDYSLMFLPLAIIAVFSLRDPWFVRASLALLLVWWQPIELPIHAVPLLIIKLLALVAVGVCLVRRAEELSARAAGRAAPERKSTADAGATRQGDGAEPAPLRACALAALLPASAAAFAGPASAALDSAVAPPSAALGAPPSGTAVPGGGAPMTPPIRCITRE